MSLYRIRTVSELSGVSSATLRAWERRYGVPSPARTPSAYRLYSDADLALIIRMRDLVKNGMAAAEAARMVLSARDEHAPAASAAEIDPYAAATDRIIDATIRFDPEALEQEVAKTLSLGPAVTIYDRALGPTLHRVGDLWHDGKVTIAQEHLASQVIGSTLIHLLRLAQPESDRRIALACFADEDHVLGLYGVGLRFASWGFRTLLLGPRTPPSAIARVVEALEPEAVGLSATVMPPPPRARELVDAYADACRDTAWIVGGDASEAMREWIEARGGYTVGRDLPSARSLVERAIAERKRTASKKAH